jgi:uncharacterized protein YciI
MPNFAQRFKTTDQMPQYLVLLRPPRGNFLETITEREQQLAAEHFYYYRELLAQKKLFLAGRCEDASLGIGIMVAENEKQVRSFVDADPAVMGGMFEAEIKEFRVALVEQ